MENRVFENSDVLARFRTAVKTLTIEVLTSKDWQELEQYANRVCPRLIELAMNVDPPLRTEERRLCVLVLFGFKPNEISILLNLSPSHVTMLRSRLHEKLFGCKGSAKEFDERMWNLL